MRKLAHRIREYIAVLNLPHSSFRFRHKSSDSQIELLPTSAPTLCIVGPKCAGKSTFGDYICQVARARWFEASSIFNEARARDRDARIKMLPALQYLKARGMDLVAKELLKGMRHNDDAIEIVTGIRTIEELNTLYQNTPRLIVVFIDADSRVRFERHIRRGRDSAITRYQEFLDQDEEQKEFGLLRVAAEIADVKIDNNDSLSNYQERINEFLKRFVIGGEFASHMKAQRERLLQNELVRSLSALRRLNRYGTCDDISSETAKLGNKVRTYNTNRALKSVPEYARRRKVGNELLRYNITPAGRHFLDYVQSRFLLNV